MTPSDADGRQNVVGAGTIPLAPTISRNGDCPRSTRKRGPEAHLDRMGSELELELDKAECSDVWEQCFGQESASGPSLRAAPGPRQILKVVDDRPSWDDRADAG